MSSQVELAEVAESRIAADWGLDQWADRFGTTHHDRSVTLMISLRTTAVALVTTAALAVGAPAAHAGQCDTTLGPMNQGPTAQTDVQVCVANGQATVGPDVGQIDTVSGPTMSTPGGTTLVTAGNASVTG